jgi:mRNA interferase MazF
MVDYIPARGDFIWLNFDPQSGHEQSASRSPEVSSGACAARLGKRPALVVSHTAFNQQRGFILVCPVSNTKRKNPFYVSIPPGLAVTGVLIADQLRSLDYRSRDAELITTCSDDLFVEVLGRINPIIF